MIYAYPCEGVYGLGCDPDSKKDVFKLCELKKRSIDKGLILISGVFEHFEKYINHLDKEDIDKLKRPWPGPHTWLVRANENVPEWIKGNSDLVALRHSSHPEVIKLTEKIGKVLTSTSANWGVDKKMKSLKFGVVGNPIRHSRSPEIHHHFADQQKIKISFGKYLVDEEDFENFVKDFFKSGVGLSVTLPFKKLALKFSNDSSTKAQMIGASNNLYKKGDIIVGDNTDCIGLAKDINQNLGFDLYGKEILILGAGGAAKGAAFGLQDLNPKTICIANRTLEKAQELVRDLSLYRQSSGKNSNLIASSFNSIQDEFHSFDLIINATSMSTLENESLPIDPSLYGNCALAYDLAYSQADTQFMIDAKNNGAQSVSDGWGMLVEQGAASFETWTGKLPKTNNLLALR